MERAASFLSKAAQDVESRWIRVAEVKAGQISSEAGEEGDESTIWVARLDKQVVTTVQLNEFEKARFILDGQDSGGGASDALSLMNVRFGNRYRTTQQGEIESIQPQRAVKKHLSWLFEQTELLKGLAVDLTKCGFEAALKLFESLGVTADHTTRETNKRFALPFEHPAQNGQQFPISFEIVALKGLDGAADEGLAGKIHQPGIRQA